MATSNTVIVGAGIIGLATAYYLSESGITPAKSIHIVDTAEALFEGCASGMAAGFLAEDWVAPVVSPLAELSFKLHKSLAETYDGAAKWGYVPSSASSLTRASGPETYTGRGVDWIMDGSSRANAASRTAGFGGGGGPEWLRKCEGDVLEVLSTGATTAQVDPRKLCEFLLEKVRERGVNVHFPAAVASVSVDARDEVAGVRIMGLKDGVETDIPCTRLILTSGPWTPQVFSTLFPSSPLNTLPITSLAGYSLILRSPRYIPTTPNSECHAVFTTDASGYSPEFFSRADGTIWFGGLNSATLPLGTEVDGASIKKLKTVADQLLGGDLVVEKARVCWRPVTERGVPIVTRLEDEVLGGGWKTRMGGEGGVFVAAGHGPWGISQSLGTGKVMAELIEGVETSVDISGLKL